MRMGHFPCKIDHATSPPPTTPTYTHINIEAEMAAKAYTDLQILAVLDTLAFE